MNYVYDIVLNLNENLYSFYDWNKEDKLELFIKIPVIKVDDDVIRDFINSKVIVSNIDLIYKKNDLYSPNKVIHKDYVVIFSSEDKCLAIEFDKTGLSTKKSYLSIDEEIDVLEYIKHLKYTILEYKIAEKTSSKLMFYTRNELEEKEQIKNYIKSIYDDGCFDKLDCLFYEVHGEKNYTSEKELIKLINTVENSSSNYEKLKKTIELFKYNTFTKKSSLNT